MSQADAPPGLWQALGYRRLLGMLLLGFSAGLPLLLIFSSLSVWLREAGVERSAITYFSWAALGYSFKFVWAPLVDRLPLPLLTAALGRRRSWLLLAQLGIALALVLMGAADPAAGAAQLRLLALAAVLLGFTAATQDIVIDALRIEWAPPAMQGLLSSAYITGYRLAMVVSGAGALILASRFGSEMGAYDHDAWKFTYWIMAAVMGVGLVTTLAVQEPRPSREAVAQPHPRESVRFLGLFLAGVLAFVGGFQLGGTLMAAWQAEAGPLGRFLLEVLRLLLALAAALSVAAGLLQWQGMPRALARETYWEPVREFFVRQGWRTAVLLLCLIGSYRVSDIVLGVISNVFYTDLGYSKEAIAAAVKTFGVVMAIAGGFAGGVLALRLGVMRLLFAGALLSAASNLLFLLLASREPALAWLYGVVALDNAAAGLASAAFVAFLSSLTDIRFTAMQYAIFSSLMTLAPKVLGGYSGAIVDQLSYEGFFILTTALGLPVLLLVWLCGQAIRIEK